MHQDWLAVDSSADGKILVAPRERSHLYISIDGGFTWTGAKVHWGENKPDGVGAWFAVTHLGRRQQSDRGGKEPGLIYSQPEAPPTGGPGRDVQRDLCRIGYGWIPRQMAARWWR